MGGCPAGTGLSALLRVRSYPYRCPTLIVPQLKKRKCDTFVSHFFLCLCHINLLNLFLMPVTKVHKTCRVKTSTLKRVDYLSRKLRGSSKVDLNFSQTIDAMAEVLEKQFRDGYQLQIK